MNVLSLDDHYEDIAPLLKAFFAGDSLCFTKTPAEARRKLEQQKFDLVVLDGDLGAGGSGPDVLRSWKARDMVLPPVVMFSADAVMRTEGIEAGAMAAIAKDTCSFEDFEQVKQRIAS